MVTITKKHSGETEKSDLLGFSSEVGLQYQVTQTTSEQDSHQWQRDTSGTGQSAEQRPPDSALTWINSIFLVMNLNKLRKWFIFALQFLYCLIAECSRIASSRLYKRCFLYQHFSIDELALTSLGEK